MNKKLSTYIPILSVTYRALRVWQRNFDTFLILWKTESWPPFIEPVLNILAMGFGLGAYVDKINGMNYIDFIAPAFIAVSIMFTSSFECSYGTFIRMEYQKTFDAIIATPVSIEDVIAGEILYGAFRGMISAAGVLVVIGCFGLIQSPLAILTVFIALLAGFMFSSIAMIVAATVPSINEFNYFFTLFISPMFLFSGVFFPLERLPEALRFIAYLSPLTHTVNIQRGLVMGHLSPSLLWDLLFIILSGFILVNIAIVLLRRRLIK